MPVESAADLASFFNPDEFGTAASYTPPGGGAATACTVLIDKQDREMAGFNGRPVMRGTTIAVQAAQIAAPATGGTFLIGATTYTILGDPITEDIDRLIWTCTVR